MAFDFSTLLQAIPETQVNSFIDGIVDAELLKVGTTLKSLIKTALDKTYGTSLAAVPSAPPLVTSAQPLK
jgi:hypothetical protein